MRLHVSGVRGSTPAPGAEFTRYGGHTSCVAIARHGEAPSLVLDGGTGLRRLARRLAPDPFRGTILLGHLHWDHTHGLPFFPAAVHPGGRTRVCVPAPDPVEVLARAMSPPHFPVRPDELQGAWSFDPLDGGEDDVEGFSVLALEVPHLDSVTFGFRVTDGSASVAYVSDHSPIAAGEGPDGLGAYHDRVLALADGVDLLLHDAQHTAAEYAAKSFLGHATVEYAVGLAVEAGARRLLLFHHDPDRTDSEIDALVRAQQRPGLAVAAAAEGLTIEL